MIKSALLISVIIALSIFDTTRCISIERSNKITQDMTQDMNQNMMNGMANNNMNGMTKGMTTMTNGMMNGMTNGMTNNNMNGMTNAMMNGMTNNNMNNMTNGMMNNMTNGMMNNMTNGMMNNMTNGMMNGMTQNMAAATNTVPSSAKRAICNFMLTPNYNITGSTALHQQTENQGSLIYVTVSGLQPNSAHGIHIHEFGDLSDGCESTGEHYNPTSITHAGPEDNMRHYGDLGNLQSDANGNAMLVLTDQLVKLSGDTSVVGRGVVIHAGRDDLGRGGNAESLANGNSGSRIACCVIGVAKL